MEYVIFGFNIWSNQPSSPTSGAHSIDSETVIEMVGGWY
jgi:hypothetical protein